MSVARSDRHGLAVDTVLAGFIEAQVLPDLAISVDAFWGGFAAMLADLTPINRALLAKRDALQAQVDAWHIARRGLDFDAAAYQAFLREIGYLLPEGDDFQIETAGVDVEIAQIAGPQLVVPITNARYALNAANARWGSLYDALYGTDALGDLPSGKGFDAARGARAIAFGRAHLDAVAPLEGVSWADVTALAVEGGAFTADGFGLKNPAQFAGYLQDDMCPLQVLLRVNGLLIEVLVDPKSTIGAQDNAGISDIYIESALSAIMDLEDSVACVDGADKVQAYGNWLGLMRGDLAESVTKGGKTFSRALNPDQTYIAPDGSPLVVKCRARMLIRNVGHLMTNPAILLPDGSEVFEGLMDAMITATIGLYDLRKTDGLGEGGARNSDTGAMYVVKPKMHGPDEVAFACQTFDRVEAILGMPANTVKLGIMDEERRTSANLKACIRAAKSRVAFINTGFLDRTGDETHTSMQAGAMLPKGEMKAAAWIKSYEDRNVDIGLACGFSGRAQIGKGMWAMPDLMAAMGVQKIAHPQAGANCAWVPSPTAAVLHALHYHAVDVFGVQAKLAAGGARASLDGLLSIPLAGARNWDAAEVARELDNNAQGILGYVVRWVDQGVGCSKVPDINNVGLMEDRATCRISSQAIANWLLHGIVSETEVRAALAKMAAVVDGQNAGDAGYRPMAPALDGVAYRAACDLVFAGAAQPSGYTEPLLHAARLRLKAAG